MKLPPTLERLALEATGRLWPLRLLVYGKEARRLLRDHRGEGGPLELLRAFPRWEQTLRAGRCALADEAPWMSFAATRHLETLLAPGARVYEYGAGGSTLFLARRGAMGASVEHDRAFARLVRERLLLAGVPEARWRVDLVEAEPPGSAPPGADPARPEDYASDDEAHRGRSFRAYASSIERFPAGHFDLVIVDGRARPACALHGAARVRPGGHLVLDNCERAHYGAALARLVAAGWTRLDLGGPVPYSVSFGRTAFLRRPEK